VKKRKEKEKEKTIQNKNTELSPSEEIQKGSFPVVHAILLEGKHFVHFFCKSQ